MYGLATDGFGQVMCLPSQQALLLSLKGQCHQGFHRNAVIQELSLLGSCPGHQKYWAHHQQFPCIVMARKVFYHGVKQEFIASDNPGIASNTDSLKYQCF